MIFDFVYYKYDFGVVFEAISPQIRSQNHARGSAAPVLGTVTNDLSRQPT